jgi:hypothetical protein
MPEAAAAVSSASCGATLATALTFFGAPIDELIARHWLSWSSSTVTSEPYTGTLCKVCLNLTVRVPVSGTVSVPSLWNSLPASSDSGSANSGIRSLSRASLRYR